MRSNSRSRDWTMWALCALWVGWLAAGTSRAEEVDAGRGRAALRAMDCARCHGRDYRGSSGPSLLAAVRDGPRSRFDWYVLQGDAARGMPGYGSQPLVVAELDAIYAYLCARAEGSIER
jgi:cytochrome c55X